MIKAGNDEKMVLKQQQSLISGLYICATSLLSVLENQGSVYIYLIPPSPVGWGCRIHRLLLCRRLNSPNKCLGYDSKLSDGEAPIMLELWGMRSTP